jgi:hypothetical protein
MPGVAATLHEFKAGKLHSGSKKGPLVRNRKQALAIGLNSVGRSAEGMVAKKGKGKRGMALK